MMIPLINPCNTGKKSKTTRRGKAQIATRKARAKQGLAFKSADLALDKKILKEVRLIKRSIKRSIKGAAKSGPHSITPPTKESAMVKSSKRRKNPKGISKKHMASVRASLQAQGRKARKKASKVATHVTKRAARKAKAYKNLKAHRPIVYKIGGKFYRARNKKGTKTSRFFGKGKAVRVNGRCSRTVRFNPFSIQGAMNKAMWTKIGSLTAGFLGGALAMPAVNALAMKTIDKEGKYSKYYGIVHILLGGLVMWKGKKAILKDAGTTLMASGVYDLIASNVAALNLPILPRTAEWTKSIGLGASYQPRALAASYTTAHAPVGAAYMQPVGSSYEKSLIVAGLSSDYGDDPYETCFE